MVYRVPHKFLYNLKIHKIEGINVFLCDLRNGQAYKGELKKYLNILQIEDLVYLQLTYFHGKIQQSVCTSMFANILQHQCTFSMCPLIVHRAVTKRNTILLTETFMDKNLGNFFFTKNILLLENNFIFANHNQIFLQFLRNLKLFTNLWGNLYSILQWYVYYSYNIQWYQRNTSSMKTFDKRLGAILRHTLI